MTAEPRDATPIRFDLRAVLTDVLATTDAADPDEVATLVDARIKNRDLRTALRSVLRGYVREHMTRSRMDAGRAAPVDTAERPAPRSWKVEGIRARAAALCASRVHVGKDDDGGERWLLLGDCTPDDLAAMVRERRDLAAATMAKADQYERLAATVQAAGVATVRNLPDDALLDALGGGA